MIALLVSIGFFSLLIGGFITVVVYRLPLMLKYEFHREQQSDIVPKMQWPKPFNLLLPSSHCPSCKQALRFLEILPFFSYIFLKGKCNYCRKKIHIRYSSIELVTLISSCLVAYRFNLNGQMFAALILTWGLIALSGIDFEHCVLPDILVLPLLWLGLIVNIFHVFVSPEAAILGASLAYLSLWLIANSYRYITKREGMGYGDFKCFALLGAWLGFYALILILLMASLLALLVACFLLKAKKISFQQAIPFGPYLCIAGWLVLLLDIKPSSFI